MKIKGDALSFSFSILAFLILFFCIGLSVIGIPAAVRLLSDEVPFLKFLDDWGLSAAFLMTVFSLFIIFIHQKIIMNQKTVKNLDTPQDQFDILERSELKSQRILNFSPVGIFQTTQSGKIIFANQALARQCGFDSVNEFTHFINNDPRGVARFYADPDLRGKIIKKLKQEPGAWMHFEHQLLRKDKSFYTASMQLSLQYDEELREQCVFGFIEDVTERVVMEEKMRRQIEVEKFLQEVTNRLVNADLGCIEEIINHCLDQIKHFFQASCVYICFFNPEGFIENCYVRSNAVDYDYQHFIDHFFMKSSSWWFDILERDEHVLFNSPQDIPDHLICVKQEAVDQGLKKVLVEPIFSHGRFVGFIGLNTTADGIDWEDRKMGLLKICGSMFLNLLEKKQIQEEILKSRERLDTAVRGAYLGMFDLNVQTGEAVFNDIWFRMLGYSPHELPHTFDMWKSLLHPDDFIDVMRTVDNYLKGTISFYSKDFRLKARNGDWKWIHAQGHVVERDSDNKPLRMVGLQQDVTELKKTEMELRHQRDIFGLLIENMPVGIYAKDAADRFKIVIWNRKMRQLIGLGKEDVLGKSDHEIFDKKAADLYLQDDLSVAEKKTVKTAIQDGIETLSGTKTFYTIKVPVFNQQGEVVMILGIIDDITEKQNMENQIRHNQKMQAIGQLAAGVAHEVKNPLAIILLAAEGLEMNKEILESEKSMDKIKMIKDAATKANKVVIELLRFSRASEIDMKWIDLHQVIDDACFLSKNRGKEKYIDFHKEYIGEPLMYYGSPLLLEQVFVNLLNNAIDAIEKRGQIYVRSSIKDEESERKSIIIEIEDTGPGIPRKDIPKIFDPFYTTKDEGYGTGLGLSTVFTIIEKHHGSIKVASQSGKGTVFTITLPYLQNIPSAGLSDSPLKAGTDHAGEENISC